MRQIYKAPGFNLVTVLTLALAVGVNAAVFAVLYRVVLKPLPFPESDRLMQLKVQSKETGQADLDFTVREFEVLQEQNQAFDRLVGVGGEIVNLYGIDEPFRAFGARVSEDFLPTYGANPILGRAFNRDDYQTGQMPVVLISHQVWRKRFSTRPDIVGRNIMIGDRAAVVCGVMPSEFHMPGMYWRPLVLTPEELQESEERRISVVARLSPGVSMQQFLVLLQQLGQRIQTKLALPEAEKVTLGAMTLHEQRVGATDRLLWILFGAVSCVTLIGIVNLINLQLSNLMKRRKEFAVRLALGASIRRIYRQGLVESSLHSIAGGVLGMMLAVGCIDFFRSKAPWNFPRANEIAPDVTILSYGFVLSLVMGVCVCLIPLARLLKSLESNSGVLKSHENSDTFTGRRSRPWFVTGQVTAATVLLIGAGLLLSSYRNIMRVDPGFTPDYLVTARLVPRYSMVAEDKTCHDFYCELAERLHALPEVAEVGFVNSLPLADINHKRRFQIENTAVSLDEPIQGYYTRVSVNYFELMGIPLLAGRPFNPTDENGEPTIIVNQAFVRRYFGEREALGQRIKFPRKWNPWMTIVGVVADVKTLGRVTPSEPTLYTPCLQKGLPTYTMKGMFFVAQTRIKPDSAIARIRAELYAFNPYVAMCNINTMQERLDDYVVDQRYHATLMGSFATLAWILVMIGIFGVLSRMVADRHREMGIRLALGSSETRIFQLVLKQGLRPVALGIGAGWLLALILHRILSSYLFGISSTHPGTFLIVGFILMATATIACTLPARRAMKLDPMTVLRYE